MDSAVLDRMAKIMSYMKVNQGKPSKKPKKKDKLAALHGLGVTGGTNFPIVHGAANIMPKPAGDSCFAASACSMSESIPLCFPLCCGFANCHASNSVGGLDHMEDC